MTLGRDTDVIVVGAGIAGVAVAHRMSTRYGLDVTLIDPRPPLTLTSDKSTECYRNWWPSASMVGLMNRSIDLLEEMSQRSGNAFGLNRRGYLFVTGSEEQLQEWRHRAPLTSSHGCGPVREHVSADSYQPTPAEAMGQGLDGVDILTGKALRAHFPYLTDDAVAALHVRRAGWLSAQQLGAWMLEEAKDHGLRHLVAEVVEVQERKGRIVGVETSTGESIATDAVVNAAGPMAARVARMAGLDLTLRSELHLKVAYRDHLGVVPRDAPMLIWSDTQRLDWDQEEREALEDVGRDDVLGEMPVFCHGRPEGGTDSPYLVALWEYHKELQEPVWPLPVDDLYPEVVARGLSTMIPGFGRYLDGLPQSVVDGGYYMKTEENRPLIGPAGPDGFYLACAYSGFGVMVAAGGADLVARHVIGDELPDYASAFLIDRYDDPDYMAELASSADSGQL